MDVAIIPELSLACFLLILKSEKWKGGSKWNCAFLEDYAHNEITLEIFKELRREFGETVGLVIQSYLYKSEQDIADLNEFHPNLRIVKGAYKEPSTVAFPEKADVDKNYIKLVEQQLLYGNFAAIATHDESIINHLKGFIKEHSIPLTHLYYRLNIDLTTNPTLAGRSANRRMKYPYQSSP